MIDDSDYNVQKKILQDALNSLVLPETDAALDAGEFLESLGLVWEKATLEEKYKMLRGMVEAVYVDMAATRSIVGIQPKPSFYPLFDSLEYKSENKVTVFRDIRQRKETDVEFGSTSGTVLVETGESRTLPETRMLQFVEPQT